MDRVAAAAERSDRPRDAVLVIAVTKYAGMDQVRELVDLGHRDLGENQVQQLVQRAAMLEEYARRKLAYPGIASGTAGAPLYAAAQREAGRNGRGKTKVYANPADDPGPTPPADTPIRWHMIGHLQRNKAKKCVETARLIHSVDSLRLVDEIHSIAFKQDREVELLVQVNCTGEKSKYGCAIPAVRHLCEQIDSLVHLKVRGLMTMGPTSGDPELTRDAFERCRELFEEIHKLHLADGRFNILSMGMSNDYELAIECGANMVRVGSAIFGPRAVVDDDEDESDDDDS